MDDFTRAYDQKYALDKSDTRDQVMESMNAEGLGDSSVGGVQMARELGKLDLQRSQDFADRQTALDEAAKSRIMSAIGAYGGQANQAVSADQADRAYRAAMNEGAIGVGDREWQSLQDVNNMYTGLSSAYDSANYNPADQAYQSLLTADMGTHEAHAVRRGHTGPHRWGGRWSRLDD
ncbi:MAG: hypothetical protein MZV70_54350 [Desulfobacterales bacterium]|nr:hypothetical protein [Desulfobacterales bacterium]